MSILLSLLFLLIAGHFLCDYPLQGDFIGKHKNRHVPIQVPFAQTKGKGIPWWHLMTAHAFIHGGAVLVITGRLELAVFETVAHFVIDCLKCEGYTDINVDQAMHILCKIGYVVWLAT